MGKFLLGVILTILVIAGGAYIYARLGYIDFRADQSPSALETETAMSFVDASVDKRAPDQENPVEPVEANLIEGMQLYQKHCAECHGGPGHPENDFGHPFDPPAPQFTKDPPDMPENQNFYILAHGIRWTGMPAWSDTLSERQRWEIVGFLSRMDKLPPAVQQKWEQEPQSAQVRLDPPHVPAPSRNPTPSRK
jgi:mono/diheme cytochrome c family protein